GPPRLGAGTLCPQVGMGAGRCAHQWRTDRTPEGGRCPSGDHSDEYRSRFDAKTGFPATGTGQHRDERTELGGEAAFGISPRRPELKEQIDGALDRIKRNGKYDHVNSKFLPFRVN